jgi:hypothetical protein
MGEKYVGPDGFIIGLAGDGLPQYPSKGGGGMGTGMVTGLDGISQWFINLGCSGTCEYDRRQKSLILHKQRYVPTPFAHSG